MKRFNSVGWARIAVLAALVTSVVIAGCNGSGPVNTGSASYSLSLLLEKNLDTQSDYLSLEFLRNDSAFVGAFVLVDGDTIRTGASGRVDTTYSKKKWYYGHTVAVKAVDTARNYDYQTSVTIPDSFGISNVYPNTRIWQPNKANPRVEWSGSFGADGYIATLQARGVGSPAQGQSVLAADRSQTFTPQAFYNPQNNQLVTDVYYFYVIAYAPTFVPRPDANYGIPTTAFPLTVDTKQITGAVAAAVVSARDTILVQPL